MRELTVRECISFGWRTFKARPWLFVGAGLVLLLVDVLASAPDQYFNHLSKVPPHAAWLIIVAGLASGIWKLVEIVISNYAAIGTRHFMLKAHDETEAAELRDLIYLHAFWRYLAMSGIYFLCVLIGFVLLIVPGIILAIGWQFAPYLVVEQGAGPIDALKRSWELTRGNRWTLFLLGLALIGLNLLGLCALVVGLLVTLPVTTLAGVHAYRTLLAARTGSEPAIETEADS